MRKQILSSLAALLLLAGAGCTHLDVRGIAPGRTTEAELQQKLGAPGMVWTEPDGGRLLEYSGQPNGTYCYMIAVGPDGRVREIRQAFSEENLRRVVPGLTQDETRRLLGAPEEKVRFSLKPDEDVWSWRIEDSLEKIVQFNAYFGADGRLLRTDRSIIDKSGSSSLF